MKILPSLHKIYQKRGSFLVFFLGLASLFWFLLRVIPKPSRAYYPCQRAAFPVASGFVIWLTTSALGYLGFQKAKKSLIQKKVKPALLWGVLAFGITIGLYVTLDSSYGIAATRAKEVAPLLTKRLEIDPNSHMPLAYVGVVQSDKLQMEDINKDEIESMVFEAIAKAGGLDSIIDDGDEVILKPNLVQGSAAVTGSGVVTDWRVVAAVAKAVRAVNPAGTIVLMEGMVGNTMEAFAHYNYSRTSIPEIDELIALEESCGDWFDYHAEEIEAVVLPAGKSLYPDREKPNESPELYLNRRYLQADVLISIPVLKNHETAGVTGAVKNVAIGCSPPTIYARSDGYPLRDAINHGYLHEFIHDFYMARPVDFAVMDGLQGYSYGPVGNGWGGSQDDLKENMRLIAASADPLALDAVEALIMMDDPRKVAYLVSLSNDGLGTVDPMNIKIVGQQLGGLKKNFAHWSWGHFAMIIRIRYRRRLNLMDCESKKTKYTLTCRPIQAPVGWMLN